MGWLFVRALKASVGALAQGFLGLFVAAEIIAFTAVGPAGWAEEADVIAGSALLHADGKLASALVADLSGIPQQNFHPLIPQWKPPSQEIESGLFALQAAAGGILVGGVFGFWIGQKKKA